MWTKRTTTTRPFAILAAVAVLLLFSVAAVKTTTVHAAKDDHDRLTVQALNGRESIRPGRPSPTNNSETSPTPTTTTTTGNGNDTTNNNGRTDSSSEVKVDGRLHGGDPDDCGFFDPIHHHLPCEIDVDMTMVKTPAPNDGRDPLTAKPSMQPTPVPTVPTTAPAAAPPPDVPSATSPTTDDEECTADDGGSFGQIGLVENIVRVEYMYEMELVDGATTYDIENDILPSLERSFVNSIIPALFPDECGTRDGDNDNDRQRRLKTTTNYSVRRRRRLRVVGLSSNPPDEVLGDVSCQAPVSAEIGRTTDTTTCFVVDGEFMFFTDNGNADAESQIALDIMAERMEDGSYADSDPQVVRLTMIDDGGSGNGPSPPAQGPTTAPGVEGGENESSTNDNALRVGLFVGIFGLVTILAGVVFRVTRRNNRDNNGESAMAEPYQADQSQNISVLTQSMPDDSPPML